MTTNTIPTNWNISGGDLRTWANDFHLHSEMPPGVIRIMSPISITRAQQHEPGGRTVWTSPTAPAVVVHVSAAVQC